MQLSGAALGSKLGLLFPPLALPGAAFGSWFMGILYDRDLIEAEENHNLPESYE